tara:strand:- start:31837 stop:32910 length:1074 start_codon:yes stop_codon:yes gene_type:complete
MPDTRPDTEFVDGVCSACIAYQSRGHVDWYTRGVELERLLSKHRIAGREFDCIVPSSGGKDSTYQVLTLIELGAKPLVVTATTCMLTDIGRKNIDNLSRYATTIEVSPNKTTRAKLNRLGLQMVGDISWPEHVAIFTTPFKIAVQMGIPLLFYGENPQNQYGGPLDSQDSKTMTRRWVSEFGGFLGLRPADMVGQDDITARDMQDYMPPDPQEIERVGVEAHFLGQYIPWDSNVNAHVAKKAGMQSVMPCKANWWSEENQDNAMTGIHDHMMYRKYGYGRGCAQISADIRAGAISRENALVWLRDHDGLFPWEYMGVKHFDVCKSIGIYANELPPIMDQFTNWDLFGGVEDMRPILK